MKYYHLFFYSVAIAILGLLCSTEAYGQAKNVILFIGDGMGPEQIRAAGMYAYGRGGTLVFESFPYQTKMTTHSANRKITDSAAASTAMATGVKVDNGVISIDFSRENQELGTILEDCTELCKSTGLVTTVPITHATPAGFASHEKSRKNMAEIAQDYLSQTRPFVLFGGGENGMSTEAALKAGYEIVRNVAELTSMDAGYLRRVSGQFAKEIPYETDGLGTMPHLSQMTEKAIQLLNNDPDGFFLMVEGGKIDWACHDNDLTRMLGEMMEFERAVQVALNWAQDREDTLLVVTADHETGGLDVIKNNGVMNEPTVHWTTKGHSASLVPVYAWGQEASKFSGPMDNTDIPKRIMEAITAK